VAPAPELLLELLLVFAVPRVLLLLLLEPVEVVVVFDPVLVVVVEEPEEPLVSGVFFASGTAEMVCQVPA
jgi:hypothetical protein